MFDKTKAFKFRLVQKCTVNNGGCDASAVCSNPTAVGEDVVCSCPDPLIFDETNTSCGEKFVDKINKHNLRFSK